MARTCLIKDERYYDRYDQAFARFFRGVSSFFGVLEQDLPADWLAKLAESQLSAEEKAKVKAMGGWQELLKALAERLAEQKERHHGGSRWIGTAGTSPFGAYGYNPEGVRIGQQQSNNRSAVKVWDRREFAHFDDRLELGIRNIKLALRGLRKFARTGAPSELDLPDTIDSTARAAGLLDLKMVPERHNAVKVLLLLDVGGSMDEHVRGCEELFSAARSEFKHLESFYFHNLLYERVWRHNRRQGDDFLATDTLIEVSAATTSSSWSAMPP